MTNLDLNKNIFGRNEILNLLKKRVIDLKDGYGHNIALIGNQHVGKSTILHHFISEIGGERVNVIYLDLENKDFHYFYSKFIGSLLYHFAKNKNLPLQDDINLLIETTKEFIPQSLAVIAKIKENYKKGKISEAYLGLLTLPEVFTNETQESCVLIFDEFQCLENLPVAEVFQRLGQKIMTQKKCLYILSSSYKEVAHKILSEKLSLLFGSFENISVEPFVPDDSQKYIELNLSPLRIGSQLRNFLTDFTGGHPLYLNLIARELKNLCAIHQQNEVYMPILSLAVENTIFDRWGVISRHFELMNNELCLGKGNHVSPMILMMMSNGHSTIESLMGVIEMKKTPLMQKINRLIEMSVVIKNGKSFYIKDKLFKYWIHYVYQKRVKDVELAPDKQKRMFKDEFNQCIETFKVSTRQDFSSRIIELLHCVDNSAFNLNGRKYKVPAFREITPFKLCNDSGVYFDVAKAEVEEDNWLIVMKKDIVCESDIQTILAESKRAKKKPKRCLIVSLMDLEENAKLKALQERFWIWNQGDINELLSLFNKPYILR